MPDCTDLESAAAGSALDSNQHTNLVTQVFAGLKIDLPATTEEQWDLATRFFNASVANAARCGWVLNRIREETPEGEFKAELDRRGFEKTEAYAVMKIAAALVRLPEKEQRSLVALSKTKILALARLDEEKISELARGETVDGVALDDIEKMSARQAKTELRRLRLEHSNTQKELRQATKNVEPDKRWPAEVARIRGEAQYFSVTIAHAADNLEKLLVELRNDLPRHVSDGQQGVVEFGAAARTVYQAIAGPLGLFNILLQRFVEQYELGDYVSNDPGDVPLLSQAEAQTLYDNWRLICQGEIADQKLRESDRRLKAHRGRPGPKPGSRNKKR